MSIAKVSLPKQWTDWTTWLLGIWLCLSPWVLLFEFETPALRNAVVVGALIILVELVELSMFRGWEEWINVALGAWLIASTWLLGIATLSARANFLVAGLLVVTLALYAIWHSRQNSEDQT
jgi:membrane-bound ClpP family serine protease